MDRLKSTGKGVILILNSKSLVAVMIEKGKEPDWCEAPLELNLRKFKPSTADHEALATALQKVMVGLPSRRSPLAMVLPDPMTQVRVLRPKDHLKKEELEHFARWRMSKALHRREEELETRHLVLPTKGNRQDPGPVLVQAFSRGWNEMINQCFLEAGLFLTDLRSAAQRYLGSLGFLEKETKGASLILMVTKEYWSLSAFDEGGLPLFLRSYWREEEESRKSIEEAVLRLVRSYLMEFRKANFMRGSILGEGAKESAKALQSLLGFSWHVIDFEVNLPSLTSPEQRVQALVAMSGGIQ